MAWPANVTSGQPLLASQYNAVVTALGSWGGSVNANGFSLSNLGGLGFTGTPAVTFPGTVTLSVAPVFGDAAGTRSALGLGAAATQAIGNLTESTSAVLTITGGSGAVLGAGTSIQVKQASGTQSGYLSSADWSTFNGKQSALGYTPLNPANNLSDLVSAATARTNLGLTAAATASLPLSIANGGTGQTTAAAGLSALGGASLTAANTFSATQTINASVLGTLGGWASWTPTYTCSGSMTISGVTTTAALYIRVGPIIFFILYFQGTLGGASSSSVYITLPVAATVASSTTAIALPSGSANWQAGFCSAGFPTLGQMNCQLFTGAWPLGGMQYQASGIYRCA